MFRRFISQVLPIIKAICLTAIAQGVIIFFRDSLEIDIPKLVALMLDQATNPTTLEAAKWFLAGVIGIGLTVAWEKFKRPRTTPTTDATLIEAQTGLERERRLQHKQDQFDSGAREPGLLFPDWSMKEMCLYVFENLEDSDEIIREIQDKARLGTLTVWGRLYAPFVVSQNHNPMKEIPKDHWDKYTLDYLTCMRHEDPSECCTEPRGTRGDIHGSYQDLKVNQRQAKTIWPPKAEKENVSR